MAADYGALTVTFKALAHPVRLQILDMLRQGELCVCHIEAALDKRQAYISQQLMTLREAGLVSSRKDGLKVFYRLSDPRLENVLDAALGSLVTDEPDVFDDCRCPRCQESIPIS
jgi:DNA-binding transcriptional ArsR family regulator